MSFLPQIPFLATIGYSFVGIIAGILQFGNMPDIGLGRLVVAAHHPLSPAFLMILLLGVVTMPLALEFVLYVIIIIKLYAKRRKVRSTNGVVATSNDNAKEPVPAINGRRYNQLMRTVKLLLGHFCLQLACVLPSMVLSFTGFNLTLGKQLPALAVAFDLLQFCMLPIAPFVFARCSKEINAAYKRLWRRSLTFCQTPGKQIAIFTLQQKKYRTSTAFAVDNTAAAAAVANSLQVRSVLQQNTMQRKAPELY